MRVSGSVVLALTLAACGDASTNTSSDSASGSGTGETGASTGTGTGTGTGEPLPTTTDDDGTASASESQGTTGTGTGTGDTTTTDPLSATDTDATTGTTDGASETSQTDTSTGEPCSDECDADAVQCVGDDALQVCGVGDEGCLQWAEPSACDDGHVCTAGVCAPGCVDACAPGSEQCVGGGVSTCVDDPQSSCSVWSDPVVCDAGDVCDAGQCVTPADLCLDDCVWTKQQVNVGVDLYSVWGSGAAAVWTVGASGTALYYNGVSWKAVDTGVGTRLECVHGSAADDVYAISGEGQIIRWDGGEWLPHVDLDPIWGESACLSVIGPKDLLALIWDSNGDNVRLFRVQDGVKSLLTSVSPQYVFTPDGSKIASVSLHAFSADAALATADRAYRWQDGALKNIGSPNPSFGLWALAPDFAYAAAPHSGIGHRWDGQAWKIVNPGLDGYLHMFTGTAKTRVFAVGETKVGAVAAIVAFDGIGWSPASTPADAKALFAAWSGATGEVFAVGKAGTILIGE